MAKKRSNGEGTIYKRKDGRWCAAYVDEKTNARHYVYANTQTEVKKKLKAAKEQPMSTSRKQQDSTYSVEEWVKTYLEQYKKNEVKVTTFDSYMIIWRKHIQNSDLGKIKVDKLSTDDLQKFYNKKVAAGYNSKTIRHISIVINMSLSQAVKLHLINNNPNAYTTLPKKKRYEAEFLGVAEVRSIVENAKNEELYPLVVTALYTGMRKGELLALSWKDVDFEHREIHVHGSLCRVESIGKDGKRAYVYQILEPKTEKSNRTIPILNEAYEALMIQKERQNREKEMYGAIYQDLGLVFAELDGTYLLPRKLLDKYHAFAEKYGLTVRRFHSLRHSFASLLIEADVPSKVVQELLGHTMISTTLDIYSHITPETKTKAVEKMEEFVKSGRRV